jgi:hypothetical protein
VRFLALVLAVAVAACAAPDGDICREAADHVAACTGEAPAELGTCDPDVARGVVDTSCDELATTAGKSDGFWDALMCALGFTSHCAPPTSDPSPRAKTLTGSVQKFGTIEPVSVVLHVRAIRDGNPADVHGSFTINGAFAIGDLAPAKYKLEVSFAPTSTAIATQTVDLATTSFAIIHVPL